MASNPPGKCCTVVNLHEGTPVGEFKALHGVDTYVTGQENPSSRVVVIVTDIFGYNLPNTMLNADKFAKHGNYQVYIPDILMGDIYDPTKETIEAWFGKHPPAKTQQIVETFLKGLREKLSPSFVGLVGYCFGAKYAVQQVGENALADAVAIAHPSFVSMEEVAAIKKPVIISAAEVDSIFPAELRHATEDKLAEIKARYQLDLFCGVSHGFACRGDLSDPLVRYAAEKTLTDQLHWFSQF